MERAFQEIHLLTWNYADHDLACLSDFPDANTFYDHKWPLPEEFASLLYIATCNRVEVYIQTDHREKPITFEELLDYFHDMPIYEGLKKHTPVYKRGLDSVRHLFQMSSGLKSMALGETQITGQLKRDYAAASELGYISSFFHSLIQKVLEAQKKIRTQTKIGQNPISLLSLLEREIMAETPSGKLELTDNAAIGGTGDMCQKALRYLINKGVHNFWIVRNDTSAPVPASFQAIIDKKAQTNGGIQITYVNWADLYDVAEKPECPIFITSTSSEEPILDAAKIERLRDTGFLSKDGFIADFGIPPNVNAEGVENRVINLNRLLKQSKINKNLRGMHYREALPIIEKSIHIFWMDHLYSKNPDMVNSVLKNVDRESREEWDDLLAGPLKNATEKQKRILLDFMKKQERRALRTHKELFVDMLTVGEEGSLTGSIH